MSSDEVDFGGVKIFLCDVDGVLTNAGVFLDGKTEFKQFNIQDGMGLRMLQQFGVPVGWVSNRHSDATTARAEELQVDYLWQESKPKVAAVADILEQAGFSWGEACFMSDDINDDKSRIVYENDEIGIHHSFVTFKDGNTHAVMAVYKYKDGKIISLETGATNMPK